MEPGRRGAGRSTGQRGLRSLWYGGGRGKVDHQRRMTGCPVVIGTDGVNLYGSACDRSGTGTGVRNWLLWLWLRVPYGART